MGAGRLFWAWGMNQSTNQCPEWAFWALRSIPVTFRVKIPAIIDFVCLYVCMYVSMCICMYMCDYMCVCVCVCVLVCVQVCVNRFTVLTIVMFTSILLIFQF